jgi:hypothetical protein
MDKKNCELVVMKFFLAICLSFIIIFLTNCTVCSCKKVPCPAFNDSNFSAWFPYSTGQQIIFNNNSSFDTISFYVDKSEAYEATQGCYGASGGCTAQCSVYSNELSSSYNRKLQIVIYGTSPKNISFNLYQFSCTASDILDTGLVAPSSSSKYYSSLQIGNSVYNQVQLIQKDTSGNIIYQGPYKIYFAKNQGIVAYENYPDLRTWIKQ